METKHKESNDIMADSLKKYADVLEHFDDYDLNTKKRIVNDLVRDLSALVEFFKTL